MRAELRPLRSIAHYDRLEKIGEGGMGLVYRAHDRRLDRIVALKFLRESLIESESEKSRFLREARAISRLSHRHIATIHSIEECDGETFLVFEYLPGGTLHSRLRSLKARLMRLPIRQAAGYGLQIAEALAHAHSCGIIHRDVKPGNIMFARDGGIKLVDFGLSKFLGAETQTSTGRLLGTFVYMSPEQAQGAEIDARSDIFSLGLVLYEMVAGQPPFSAERPEAVLHQIMHGTAPDVSETNPECPAKLALIIHRALERNRDARYPRMLDLAADLRSFVSGSPAPSEAPTRSLAEVRRAPRRWAIVAALVVALAGVFAWSMLRARLPAEKHLAILPFEYAGNDPAGQAFGDGLMESAITALRHLQPDLVVTPASEIRRLAISSPEAARQLAGANLVISGKLRRTARSVDVDLQLLEPRKSTPVGSAQIHYNSGELGSIQEMTGASLAKLLGLKISAYRKGNASRVAAANEAYLEATGYLQRFDIGGNSDRAIGLLQRATQQDPDFSASYVALSVAYRRKYRDTKDLQFLDRARDSADKALVLNSSSANAHAAAAEVLSLSGDQERAIREFQGALSLDPLDADALRDLAAAYDAQGRLSEAEATYRKAVELWSNDWVTLADLGTFYNNHQKYAEAEKQFRAVVTLVPDSPLQHRNLGGVYIALGHFADAERELLKAIELGASVGAYSNLGALYIYVGRYRDAIESLEKATRLPSAQVAANYRLWGNLGDAYRYSPDQATKAPKAYQSAIQKVEQQLAFAPDSAQLLSDVAVYEAKLGDRVRALDAIGRAMRFANGNRKVSFQAALVYELAGARDRALAALGDAVRGGYSLDEIAREPELARLRQDPRYQQLFPSKAGPNLHK